MSLQPFQIVRRGVGPIIAAAIHDGHDTRAEVAERLRLGPLERRREEDPYTAEWAQIANTQIIGRRSRFEVDLNRPREKAVYLVPADAWDLNVWKSSLEPETIEASLAVYDSFYQAVEALLRELLTEHDRLVVYDLHTYNHRRAGADSPAADERENPQVNVGTGTMQRASWSPVVDRFIDSLRNYEFPNGRLDVRENVRFQGGYFGRWIHETFPDKVCSLAIEIRKFFMDEWTGQADMHLVEEVYRALQSTVPEVQRELEKL